jgi:7-carboxy-7-deazaguanine synthase
MSHCSIENSAGGVGEKECWGKPAAWCDYSGPVEGQTVGIAVMDHPGNLRSPVRWHVRDYGLLTTNCFGESTFAGLPCVFVRTTVCDLRCVWCDTPHAFTQGTPWTLEAILEKVREFDTPLVEVTGGEPLVQEEVLPLLRRLCDEGYTVLLETSGGRDVSQVDRRVHIILDLKCPDSGELESNLWSNLDHLKPGDQIKFVIASKSDYEWAKDVMTRHRLPTREILLSPAQQASGQPGKHDGVDARWLAERILEDRLPVRMQVQLHKLLWGADRRGV